jgi:hypothetical protein
MKLLVRQKRAGLDHIAGRPSVVLEQDFQRVAAGHGNSSPSRLIFDNRAESEFRPYPNE